MSSDVPRAVELGSIHERRRREIVATIPGWYSPLLHLAAPTTVGLGVMIGALLREHHRRHHDPRLMKRWNFNVTIPVFDWIHRSVWSPEREAAADARRAERRRRRGVEAHG